MFIENTQIKILSKISNMSQIKVYLTDLPGIYNLQTRTLTFPEKWNLRYLKTLKFKKLNAKNPKIKYFLCLKYVMIYRPDLHNLQARKKKLKK